ncbi:TetR/AcrR family transcriptional regulator [Microbacterium sp. X-17]|uniref:TetR/AcrR family transcriptional regulator n=1 Tax=Microbacterium sp. X-17 TaxID=3144404 RepID=UPI0031F47E75
MTTSEDRAPEERLPRRRGPRGPYAKSEKTREAILDAALAVFAEGGFRGGSLREIASRVGVTDPALLHHFGTKSGLLEAVLRRRDELARAQVPLETGDPMQVVTGLIELVRFNASTPGVVDLYSTLAAEATTPSHPVHEYFAERYRTVRGGLRGAFRELDGEGMLRDGVDPEWAADATVALMDGLQVQWLHDPTSVDMAGSLARFIELVVRSPD